MAGGLIQKQLDYASREYQQTSLLLHLKKDSSFIAAVVQRIYYLSLDAIYYYEKLAELFLKVITDHKPFHMPKEEQKTRIGKCKNMQQNIDLLISELLNHKSVTTITEIAWFFAHIKYEDHAREFAKIAIEMGDYEAEEVLDYLEEEVENDSLYESEIRHMRGKSLGGSR